MMISWRSIWAAAIVASITGGCSVVLPRERLDGRFAGWAGASSGACVVEAPTVSISPAAGSVTSKVVSPDRPSMNRAELPAAQGSSYLFRIADAERRLRAFSIRCGLGERPFQVARVQVHGFARSTKRSPGRHGLHLPDIFSGGRLWNAGGLLAGSWGGLAACC